MCSRPTLSAWAVQRARVGGLIDEPQTCDPDMLIRGNLDHTAGSSAGFVNKHMVLRHVPRGWQLYLCLVVP